MLYGFPNAMVVKLYAILNILRMGNALRMYNTRDKSIEIDLLVVSTSAFFRQRTTYQKVNSMKNDIKHVWQLLVSVFETKNCCFETEDPKVFRCRPYLSWAELIQACALSG